MKKNMMMRCLKLGFLEVAVELVETGVSDVCLVEVLSYSLGVGEQERGM